MHLEPYSSKKAIAMQKLISINLNVIQTESVLRIYSLDQYVIVFTPKRLICVEEGAGGGINVDSYIFEKLSNMKYHVWTIFYDDIMRINMDILLQEMDELTGSVTMRPVRGADRISKISESGQYHSKVLVNLKIFYTEKDAEDQAGLLSDFRVDSKEIFVQRKDFNQVKKIYAELFLKSKQNLM